MIRVEEFSSLCSLHRRINKEKIDLNDEAITCIGRRYLSEEYEESEWKISFIPVNLVRLLVGCFQYFLISITIRIQIFLREINLFEEKVAVKCL